MVSELFVALRTLCSVEMPNITEVLEFFEILISIVVVRRSTGRHKMEDLVRTGLESTMTSGRGILSYLQHRSLSTSL